MDNESHSEALAREITRLLSSIDRNQLWLSQQSGVSQSTLSRIMTGFHKDPAKLAPYLSAIARALDVESSYLLRIAGISLPPAEVGSNPEVEYLAQRIYELPPELQAEAVDTLGSVLDTIYKVAGLKTRTAAEEISDAANYTVPESEEYRSERRAKYKRS